MDFEQKLKELEKLVEKLASGDLSLEDSLKSFERGLKLSKDCHKELDQAEQKAKQLTGFGPDGEAQMKDFEGEK